MTSELDEIKKLLTSIKIDLFILKLMTGFAGLLIFMMIMAGPE